MARIEQLWLYPVKSLAGLSVSSADIGEGGFVDDRQWMVVDAHSGRFMSQRRHPKMALIQPQLSATHLHLSTPSAQPMTLARQAQGPRMEVGVWEDRFEAQVVSEAANQWFSDVLGVACVLVKKLPNTRQVDARYVDSLRDAVEEVSFADGFPFMLLGTATLEELNEKLDSPIDVQRLRPNIVVSTEVPGTEDTWTSLTIEGSPLTFFVVKACSRCNLINVDQDTGQPHPSREPLKTLATYRKGEDGKVYMGQNLVHRGQGTLSVGQVLNP